MKTTLLLLLLYPLSLTDTVVTILLRLTPFSFQDLDSKTGVYWVITGKVAVRESTVNLMVAMVGDAFKVAHNVPSCDLPGQRRFRMICALGKCTPTLSEQGIEVVQNRPNPVTIRENDAFPNVKDCELRLLRMSSIFLWRRINSIKPEQT